MKKLLFILFVIPIMFLSGCGEFNKYEFHEARFIGLGTGVGSFSFYRICNEETIPEYDDGWVDTSCVYCKSLKVKYVNDYAKDEYTLVIKYKLFSGEEKTKIVDIFFNSGIQIDYL